MSGKIIGPDGVEMLYKTAAGGTEFFLNMNDPYKQGSGHNGNGQFNISYGNGSQFPFTKGQEGSLTFFNTTGSPITYHSGSKPGRSVRLDVYPDGGKWNNNTSYSWKSNPGYLYTQFGIGSGEFTVFIRVHGDLGTHQAFAGKIGGRDEDAIRSLIEMVYPTASHSDIQVNYNYAHFPYVNASPNILFNPPQLADDGKWRGMKVVHKIAPDRKSSDWEMWVDIDPFDANGAPKNNWQLAATYHDTGVPAYNNVPLTWKCQKDLFRIDGFANVDFTLISDREIDFGAPIPIPVPVPTPTPTPTPPPTASLTVPDALATTIPVGGGALISVTPVDSIPNAVVDCYIVKGSVIHGVVDDEVEQSGNTFTFRYSPPTNDFTGTDSFLFQAGDENGQQSNVGTATIQVVSTPTRTQTRTTTTGGDPVPDQFWTVTNDSGPLPGAPPIPGPLPISAVTAIGFEDPNKPENTLDNDLTTRWSNDGAGSWIQYDLGQVCALTEVDIAWYRGDQRTATFSIDISADRKSFKNIFQGISAGNTLQLQPVPVTGNAVLVKITCNGNSENTWASITEVVIKGEPGSAPPTPVGAQAVISPASQTVQPGTTVTLDGSQSKGDIRRFTWTQTTGQAVQILNANSPTAYFVAPPSGTQNLSLGFSLTVTDAHGTTSTANAIVTVQATQPPPPGGSTDVFGIQKVYGDKAGTFNNWDIRDSSRYYEQKPVDLGNGWFTYNSLQQGRIEVLPVAGLSDGDIDTYVMDTLIGRGYTHLQNNDSSGNGDWGGPGVGIEMTIRYRNVSLGSGSYEAHPEFVWGTFRQSTSSSPAGKDGKVVVSCEAGSYHANLYYQSNRAKFERDMKHTSGYSTNDPEFHGVVGIDGKAEHVHKAVFYTAPNSSVPGSGGQEVHLEQYLSTDGGKTFKQIAQFVDKGQWGPNKTSGTGKSCGYVSDFQPISNAKCAPGIRIDFMNSFEFKDFSIRTVDPAKKLV